MSDFTRRTDDDIASTFDITLRCRTKCLGRTQNGSCRYNCASGGPVRPSTLHFHSADGALWGLGTSWWFGGLVVWWFGGLVVGCVRVGCGW